jgi:hypothetical protein
MAGLMKRASHLRQSLPIVADRIRTTGTGGWAFLPNRFLHEGFFAALSDDERVLYLLLVLAANRQGLSAYHYDSLCDLLRWPVERYLNARNSLINKDLVAYDGTRFQVLELPASPPAPPAALTTAEDLELYDPATIHCLARQSLSHHR